MLETLLWAVAVLFIAICFFLSVAGRAAGDLPLARWARVFIPRRRFTMDEAATVTHDIRGRFYTTEQLGEKRALTPEGFLVCMDVPIARTGTMIYGAEEVPVEPNADGTIRIHREAEDIFNPVHVFSYAGKPVVNDHPVEDVRPDNWRELAVGTVMSPRRGSGAEEHLIIADLVITCPVAIADVQAGKREVSCGYDADYVELQAGEGKQINLVGNHVALVASGRCGPRCAIGDQQGVHAMTTQTRDKARDKGWTIDRLVSAVREAWKNKDEKGLEEALEAAEGESAPAKDSSEPDTHVHLHTGAERMSDEDIQGKFDELHAKVDGHHKEIMDAIGGMATAGEGGAVDPVKAAKDKAIEEELEAEAPKGTGDQARKARDSAFMADSFQETASIAEILAPGISIPTFDAASDPKNTLNAVIKLRRTALDLAYATPEGRGVIDTLLGGKTLDCGAMKGDEMRTLFRAAGAMRRAQNNDGGKARERQVTAAGMQANTKVRTIAELNELHRKAYPV